MDRINVNRKAVDSTFIQKRRSPAKKRKTQKNALTHLAKIEEKARFFTLSNFTGRVADTFPKTMSEANAYWQFQESLMSPIKNAAGNLTGESAFSIVDIRVNASASKIESDRTERGLYAKEEIKKGTFIANYLGEFLTLEEFEARYPLKGFGKLESVKVSELRDTGFTNQNGELIVEINDVPETRSRDINGLEASLKKIIPGTDTCIVALSGYRVATHTLKLTDNLFVDSQTMHNGQAYLMGIAAFANSADENFVDDQSNNASYYVDIDKKQIVLVANKDIKKDEEILVSYIDLNYGLKQ